MNWQSQPGGRQSPCTPVLRPASRPPTRRFSVRSLRDSVGGGRAGATWAGSPSDRRGGDQPVLRDGHGRPGARCADPAGGAAAL